MIWSPQQEAALDAVGRWIKSRNKPFYQLAGYAGTGKTTLAKHLAESVKGQVYFAAYTGKAAHVLAKSGAPNVSTIHQLIYQPKDRNQSRLKQLELDKAELLIKKPVDEKALRKIEDSIAIERKNLSRPMFQLNSESPLQDAALLVVDEYSMIDAQMGADLLSFGCPILALGDPGQLPPVAGKSFFDGPADTVLTEIHRQAQDNPILRMASDVRFGRALRPGQYGSSRVVRYGDISREDLQKGILGADQLLVGRNATRISSNGRMRELLGRSSKLPQRGDKLVCLRNDHQAGLLNGQIWTAEKDAIWDGQYAILNLSNDDGKTIDVSAHGDYFEGSAPNIFTKRDAQEFDYGFALTVHKAQGSQWDNVLLLDEWFGNDRERWLYTAITRAAESITVVQM